MIKPLLDVHTHTVASGHIRKNCLRGFKGKALLLHLVKTARKHNCGRMEWTCLDWNNPSIDFYLSLGAVPMDEWTTYRLDAATLERLGSQ